MPKAETRKYSRGKFQYQELSFSNPRRKNSRLFLSLVKSTEEIHTPARSISTPIVRSQPRKPSAHINRPLAYMARAHAFATFNGGSPLLLAQRYGTPTAALKSILEFTGEISIS